MKTPLLSALALLASAPMAFADFSFTNAGPYDYNNTANWSGGTINNTWSTTLTDNQSITFAANTTLSSGLSINNTGLFNHTFSGSGADRTLTLGGGISLGSNATNANKVTLGSNTTNQGLNIDLGGTSRNFFTGTNRTLEIINVVSGAGGVAAQGTGTLRFAGTNTFTGAFSFGGSGVASSVVEVTKLADGGQASSIGSSSNAADRLVFGGNNTGTLRYIGGGDSTDRRFSAGGVGAIFDASGTGAIKWTNTANASWSGTSGTLRAITLTGTSAHDNTMSAGFTNNGSGATSILKQGTGRWILAGTNTYTGGTIVNAGTLETGLTGSFGAGNVTVASGAFLATGNATSFADNATLTFASTSTAASISLSAGTDLLGAVYDSISATYLAAGTYNAAGLNSAFGTTVFTGLGSLTVSAIPEPSTYATIGALATLAFAGIRRRRR
ncbi:beta strand repeat-containing protein [Rariglobus hedericola]|uniref:PEP-CTERM sorting domain-containing protein n=1 Tax=Rariglobus hedericola TaxID=2597822 RepID=A0A556QS96_9BACT|nr:autotransporter-associated beta strand repeat-containing protein [Rariglobus hedericola]TSJ79502.1 PEP-CTERM sorting domain-containing protein [Rariglobus hedericola]